MRSSSHLLLPHFLVHILAVTTPEVLAEGDSQPNLMELLGKGIQKELQTVNQPIEEAIIHVASTTCAQVKKFFGLTYEQMKGEREPTMSSLSLVYKTRIFTTIMNISSAAEALRYVQHFEKDQRLVVFLHGFTDNPTKEGFANLTRSYFLREHVSLLALDASSLLRWLYMRSSTHTRFIGQMLAQFLAATLQYGQDPSLIHIIGHSLGAHIAGFTGKHFYALTRKVVGRITGLDPAGPCFSHVDPDLRLKHTDALFVDVIHTDAGIFGIKDALGHKDYYPNSGSLQPNCLFPSCSHSRSWLLYGESVVHPHAFPALRCKDWDAFKKGECAPEISYMGYSSADGGRDGLYFLQTDGNYPYGLGVGGVSYHNTDGIVQNIGNFFG